MISKNSKWVTAGNECESPVFHRSFVLPENTVKAEISICGLGFFEGLVLFLLLAGNETVCH